MHDEPIEFGRGEFLVSTDRRRLDLHVVLELLRATHWGGDLQASALERAVANSLCFGLFRGAKQVGFARAVTDLATYAYLTDVVVAEGLRGQGLGEWLTRCILDHPGLRGLRRVALLTRDARTLYERLGFVTDSGPLLYMERR